MSEGVIGRYWGTTSPLAAASLPRGGAWRSVGEKVARSLVNRSSNVARTFVGDTGLFAERVPGNARAIGDEILAAPPNRVLITPQVARELVLPRNILRLTEAGSKARASAWAQFRRLLGSEASVRLTLAGGLRQPAELLRKAFSTADLSVLRAAARRSLSVVTTDTKLAQQASSIPGVKNLLGGTVPPIHTVGTSIKSAADLAGLIK